MQGVRTRPDQGHLTPQNVQQLRQFVDAQPPQPFADARDSAVVARGLAVGQQIGLALVHRTELEDDKRDVVVAMARLAEQDGAGGFDLDRRGDRQ
jgi:hypothetical protein